jgi:UDP-N-acetylmuramoyl-L-alanyl-D-glutamate--2,6-diaminopimelate ligase
MIQQIDGLEIKGSKEIEITGITSHSKSVAPGNLFIAKRGKTHDGAAFIPDAVAAGASAVLTDLYNPFLPVAQLIHSDIASVEAQIASQFYHDPAKQLAVIGVTGTNGKTTVSYLLKHLFEKLGVPSGLIGTVEWIVGDHKFPSTMTTPDVLTTQKLLSDMVLAKAKAAILEVSSHGLDQNRVAEIPFSIAIFTNLSPEHLDYHGDMESYRAAKEKLFTGLSPDKWAVFNADETAKVKTQARVFSYGIDGEADLRAENVELGEKKTRFAITYQGKKHLVSSPLVGKFNVYNVLAALAAATCYGLPLDACVKALKTFRSPSGRLEQVADGVFVDFAHTPDALKNVIETLSELKKGKLITVFGCGGDRDREKRPQMGEVASTLSDLTILTSDNPRSENPEAIISQILKGVAGPVNIQIDRHEAIRFALSQKGPDDLVLIAGKGHEREQIFAHYVQSFDDAEVVKKLCEEACIGS